MQWHVGGPSSRAWPGANGRSALRAEFWISNHAAIDLDAGGQAGCKLSRPAAIACRNAAGSHGMAGGNRMVFRGAIDGATMDFRDDAICFRREIDLGFAGAPGVLTGGASVKVRRPGRSSRGGSAGSASAPAGLDDVVAVAGGWCVDVVNQLRTRAGQRGGDGVKGAGNRRGESDFVVYAQL